MPLETEIYGSDGVLPRKILTNADGSIVGGGGAKGSLTERSGSLTAGNISQQMMAANTARKYLFIQNPSTLTGQGIAAAETLFIRFGASAATVNTGTSIELVAGATFIMESNYVSTQAVQVIATTINHKFIALEG